MEENIFHEIISGNFDNVKTIVDKNINTINLLDKMKRTPLMEAIIQHKVNIALFLIEKKSNINAREIMDWTPLHFAVQERQYEIVKKIIENGGKIDPIDKYGKTPLSLAVYNYKGDGKIIELLLKNNADPNKKNKFGVSSRSLAETISDTDVIKFFK